MSLEDFKFSVYKEIASPNGSMVLEKRLTDDGRILLVLKRHIESRSHEVFLGDAAIDFADQCQLIEDAYEKIDSLEKYNDLVTQYRTLFSDIFNETNLH